MADFLKKFTSFGKEKERGAALTPEKGLSQGLPEKEKSAESGLSLGQNREILQTAPAQTPADEDKISTIEERASEPQTKSERQLAIENVMTDGLQDVYLNLDEPHRLLVKQEGERVAGVIENLIEAGKAAAKRVLFLIRDWLEKIPGVNKYFLEQESKIKTDKIMALAKKTEEELYKE